MLTSFRAKSFRCFRDLKIDRLGRVNLIVGKNGVGKTSLLEAIWLYASGGQLSVMREILGERDEFFQSEDDKPDFFAQIRSLFYGRRFAPGPDNTVILGPMDADSMKASIRLAWWESIPGSEDRLAQQKEISLEQINDSEGSVGLVLITSTGKRESYQFDWRSRPMTRPPMPFLDQKENLAHIPPFLRSHRPNSSETFQRWDSIVLSDSEDRVIDCLSILAPIERITSVVDVDQFLITVGRRPEKRIFLVRLKGSKEPQPLRSLGCGVESMLQTAVALEYAYRSKSSDSRGEGPTAIPGDVGPMASGVILIDEIESGIHYSVLGDYWTFLFNLAEKLDIQIFATTHSWECLRAFQQAATANENSEGMLIRLEDSDNGIRSIIVNEEDLALVTRSNIEVR